MKVRPKTTREYNVYQDAWVDEAEAISLLIQLMATLPASDVLAGINGWREEQQRQRDAESRLQLEASEARDRRMNSPA